MTIAPGVAGAGVTGGLLGTVKRPEGSTQVTYDGWPLYYFNRDTRAGDVAGQALADDCGAWYVVSAAGAAVTAAAPAAPVALPRTGTGCLSPDGQNGALIGVVALGSWALLKQRASV